MIKKADMILGVSIIAVTAVITLAAVLFAAKGKTVVISVNNEIYGEYSIDDDKTVELLHNTVVIKNGEVCVSHADCRDQICVNKGKIKNVGECIVCLPNGVVVEIKR